MKIVRSFGYAAQGIETCCKTENNFKIQLCLSALAIVAGFLFSISTMQWVMILFCIALVLSLEMMNTVIEKICNFIHPGTHPLIKVIKDISAGAVLLASIISIIAGTIIFLPGFFSFLKSV